ncbi:MAG TPA: hypothetical protein VEH84_16800, partial [Alphaproteobacteria bacterium]|nr:hypothetical protein [Alphaproteobacteria bacterium]
MTPTAFHQARHAAARPQSRPQSRRPRIGLDGTWEFRFDGAAAAAESWRPIQVPGIWQAQFADLRYATGTAEYRHRFAVPAEWAEAAVTLGFDGVFEIAEVELNGRPVGRNEGGFLPFAFELAAGALQAGDNEIRVRVTL